MKFLSVFWLILTSRVLWWSPPAIIIYLIALGGVTGLYNLFLKAAILGAFFVFIALMATVHVVNGWHRESP